MNRVYNYGVEVGGKVCYCRIVKFDGYLERVNVIFLKNIYFNNILEDLWVKKFFYIYMFNCLE